MQQAVDVELQLGKIGIISTKVGSDKNLGTIF